MNGVTAPRGNFRDEWMSQIMSGEKTNSTSGTGNTWNAVFEDDADKGVSVDDFLNLMVAQLRNQDFMNPVDDTQYVTQLAQFATMSQMQELAANMKNNYALSLAGKSVTCAKFAVSGALIQETGVVTKVSLVNNSYEITVNGKTFALNQIMEINGSGSTSGSTGGTTGSDSADKAYMLSLLGKTVKIVHDDETITGVVDRVSSGEGALRVLVGDVWYPLSSVVDVVGDKGEATDPDENGGSGEVTDPEENGGSGEVTDPDENGGSGEVTDPSENSGSGEVTDPDENGGSGEVTDPDQSGSSGETTDPGETETGGETPA